MILFPDHPEALPPYRIYYYISSESSHGSSLGLPLFSWHIYNTYASPNSLGHSRIFHIYPTQPYYFYILHSLSGTFLLVIWVISFLQNHFLYLLADHSSSFWNFSRMDYRTGRYFIESISISFSICFWTFCILFNAFNLSWDYYFIWRKAGITKNFSSFHLWSNSCPAIKLDSYSKHHSFILFHVSKHSPK